jgi:hypothetical protein
MPRFTALLSVLVLSGCPNGPFNLIRPDPCGFGDIYCPPRGLEVHISGLPPDSPPAIVQWTGPDGTSGETTCDYGWCNVDIDDIAGRYQLAVTVGEVVQTVSVTASLESGACCGGTVVGADVWVDMGLAEVGPADGGPADGGPADGGPPSSCSIGLERCMLGGWSHRQVDAVQTEWLEFGAGTASYGTTSDDPDGSDCLGAFDWAVESELQCSGTVALTCEDCTEICMDSAGEQTVSPSPYVPAAMEEVYCSGDTLTMFGVSYVRERDP